jgi:repressor LexA
MKKIINRALTPKQKKILDLITAFTKKKGYAPSLGEISEKFGLAVSTVHQHVKALKSKGYLKKEDNHPRGITLPEQSSEAVEIFLMGIISAGGPIEAIRNPEPLKVPRSILPKGTNHYALKVLGTSMIEEGIFDGDIIIVKEQATVDDGEKAVVYLPDKNAVTLKKVYRGKNHVKLVPANRIMKPFYEDNVEIQGRVIGVLRKEF